MRFRRYVRCSALCIAFQRRFPDGAACATYLASIRRPEGFRCPACGGDRAWQLETKLCTWECADCRRRTSVTAGTILHGSKLPLTVWFWASHLMATHSNGISALQLQRQLGLGYYGSGWQLCGKLRQAMVDPDRNPLSGLVEIDESSIPHRTNDDPVPGGQGRGRAGRMAVIGAVEIISNGPGRIRLAPIAEYSATSIQAFIATNIAAAATVKTDGQAAYPGMPEVTHESHVIGPMAAHIVLLWTHRVFANLKQWALGVYHSLHYKHLRVYLDEFVFRFDRRRCCHAAFRSLLRLFIQAKPMTYKMLIAPEARA